MSDFRDRLFAETLQQLVWRRSLSLTRNEDDAGDLMNDTFLKALEKEHLFDGKNIDRWVMTICRNLFFDKQKKRKETLLGKEEAKLAIDGLQESVNVVKDLEYCLKELDDEESEIIAMAQVMSSRAIAEELNISSANLRVKKHRARAKLAECMGLLDGR